MAATILLGSLMISLKAEILRIKARLDELGIEYKFSECRSLFGNGTRVAFASVRFGGITL